MTNRRDLKTGKTITASVLLASIVLATGNGIAEEQTVPLVIHYIDTSIDRVPALTAFPKYPSVARRDRIQGEATVCFKIKASGKISRPVVTETTHRIFSRPALRAIRKSSYEPIGPGQILATARTCRIYRFRLDPILVKIDSPE